ncbi:Acetoacetyl-CoA synthase [Parvularcula bermudensis HTCC2503]|uniref:Acetoacetyl-CoA synthase n=1 Tax=Parvularcula bermudensis (strain ATCC BAA-594 / HTCC2503 / KCTC 12087) TaxID=314260 RepID=E0TFE7_PARBH|nr:acetoacetate--CoA ligase [Parvularcula bermudensis]ADM09548.1 Acetoacetyl-CoA synthase [Parvularcula bermudensis HTCC2503]
MAQGDHLWTPSEARADATAMRQLNRSMGEKYGFAGTDTAALWRWSIDQPSAFWQAVRDVVDFPLEGDTSTVLRDDGEMWERRFFPEARLSAANLLLRGKADDPAIYFRCEDHETSQWTRGELRRAVGQLAHALKAAGVTAGDRVGGVVTNRPESVAMYIATLSLGAIWTSCAPDFGVESLKQRFSQSEPKILFAVDGFRVARRERNCVPIYQELLQSLPSVERIVVLQTLTESPSLDDLPNSQTYQAFLKTAETDEVPGECFPFDHPAVIVYSSGTTGAPKCIVHGAGGPLLQLMKEHRFHCDLQPGDIMFYYTTCAWIMWNWMIPALANGAAIALYDGNPSVPEKDMLFAFAEEIGVSHLGMSAMYIDMCRKRKMPIGENRDLSKLRCLMSTGSPLSTDNFEYIYASVKSDLHLASISGGTDLSSCFVLGDPTSPVYSGEIQMAGLGMAVDVYDPDGNSIPTGAGELVCTRPFPSMPVYFWNDPEGLKYRGAYFEEFEGIWTHGDLIERTAHGGYVILGRSDATLNPQGIRMGTAEIYAEVLTFNQVLNCLAAGYQARGDEQIVLFVQMDAGQDLTDELIAAIKERIRRELTVNHVPAYVLSAPDLPRTRSGKLAEIAVKCILNNREVRNASALANPESLDFFRQLEQFS